MTTAEILLAIVALATTLYAVVIDAAYRNQVKLTEEAFSGWRASIDRMGLRSRETMAWLIREQNPATAEAADMGVPGLEAYREVQ